MSSKITDPRRAARVLAVREAKGMTQRAIADMLGMSMRGYQTYERGECDISTDLIEALLRTFQVSPIWLITGDGAMFLDETETSGMGPCGPASAIPDHRVAALVDLLGQLAQADRDAILSAAFARAADKKQLADLRQAVADIQARTSS